ncbi:MAG: acyltransferase [Iphinoe sp. HA4291-MV1]|nr:acyltransferase [Iphinoe sp. HA4291-MV1]
MTKKKLNLIQVFRGVAALLVVLAHGDLIFHQNLNRDFLFDIFGFGGSGVDFFFVLSGFIIFYVNQNDIGKPFKLREFFFKRFVRIYPIYWIVLTGKLLASVNSLYSNTQELNLIDYIKAYLLFPQDRTILSKSFLGVSWTLSYEIFFYLIFCLLIFLKPKFYTPIILTWFAGIFLNLIGIIQPPQNSVLLQFLLSELHIEFFLGVLAAYFVSHYRISYGKQLLFVGLFLYTLAAINYYYKIFPLSKIITFGIPSTTLVVGAAALEMTKSINIPFVLILLGDASYSIYLIHGFVMNNFTKVAIKLEIVDFLTQNPLLFSLFAIVNAIAAVFVGITMYLYIEKPVISLLRHQVPRS